MGEPNFSGLHGEKVRIEFVDIDNRVRGTGALFILSPDDGYVSNLGNGRYIISEHLQGYLKDKGVEFITIDLPEKQN